jgi:hypothetical protein
MNVIMVFEFTLSWFEHFFTVSIKFIKSIDRFDRCNETKEAFLVAGADGARLSLEVVGLSRIRTYVYFYCDDVRRMPTTVGQRMLILLYERAQQHHVRIVTRLSTAFVPSSYLKNMSYHYLLGTSYPQMSLWKRKQKPVFQCYNAALLDRTMGNPPLNRSKLH